MKYILSYASKPTVSSEKNSLYSRELIESSCRNLLLELVEVSCGTPAVNLPSPEQYQFSGRYGQTPRPIRQNLVMKRGDWICQKYVHTIVLFLPFLFLKFLFLVCCPLFQFCGLKFFEDTRTIPPLVILHIFD